MSLSCRFSAGFTATGSTESGVCTAVNGPITEPVNLLYIVELASGTGAGKGDQVYQAAPTIGASPTSINTASGGGLVNGRGEAVAMLYHRALYIRNSSASVTIIVGGSAKVVDSGFSLRPGESVLKFCGAAEATGNAIGTITLAGNGATCDIAVVGASA